jgi:hypothetical protein
MGMASQLAEKVAHLPERFAESDCSTARLLAETGYLDRPQDLKVEDLEQALAEEPALMERWLDRGHDQMLAGGWGIERDGEAYHVQSFDGDGELVVTNRTRATAEFAVRYLRVIAGVMRRQQPRA